MARVGAVRKQELELCDRACVAGLKFLQERDPNAPEACQP